MANQTESLQFNVNGKTLNGEFSKYLKDKKEETLSVVMELSYIIIDDLEHGGDVSIEDLETLLKVYKYFTDCLNCLPAYGANEEDSVVADIYQFCQEILDNVIQIENKKFVLHKNNKYVKDKDIGRGIFFLTVNSGNN